MRVRLTFQGTEQTRAKGPLLSGRFIVQLFTQKAHYKSEIRCIMQCVLVILGFSVPSIISPDLLGNTYLLARVQKDS